MQIPSIDSPLARDLSCVSLCFDSEAAEYRWALLPKTIPEEGRGAEAGGRIMLPFSNPAGANGGRVGTGLAWLMGKVCPAREPAADAGGSTYCTSVDFGAVKGSKLTGSGAPVSTAQNGISSSGL